MSGQGQCHPLGACKSNTCIKNRQKQMMKDWHNTQPRKQPVLYSHERFFHFPASYFLFFSLSKESGCWYALTDTFSKRLRKKKWNLLSAWLNTQTKQRHNAATQKCMDYLQTFYGQSLTRLMPKISREGCIDMGNTWTKILILTKLWTERKSFLQSLVVSFHHVLPPAVVTQVSFLCSTQHYLIQWCSSWFL